jgi:tetratricopeptide (TPR) repeat protein
MYERLGKIYTRRQSWDDSKILFMEVVNRFPKRASAWRNLGLSQLRLMELDNAENSFNKSNLLDNLNPDTWGYLAIICLAKGLFYNKAFQSTKQAFKLNISNANILSELGELFTRDGKLELALECFQKGQSNVASLSKEEACSYFLNFASAVQKKEGDSE